jgi:hypothetical protein
MQTTLLLGTAVKYTCRLVAHLVLLVVDNTYVAFAALNQLKQRNQCTSVDEQVLAK